MTIQELLGKIDGDNDTAIKHKKTPPASNTGESYGNIVNFAADLGVSVSAASLLRRKEQEAKYGVRMTKKYADLDEETVAIETAASMTIGQMIQEHVNNEVSWSDIAKRAGITDSELTTMRNSLLWQNAALRAMPALTIKECPTDEYYEMAIDYGVINPKGIE